MIGTIITAVVVAVAVMALLAYGIFVYCVLSVLIGLVIPPAR